MILNELLDYTEGLDNLTKIEPKIEMGEDALFYVVQTKETYVFEDEAEADAKINEARQKSGYEASTKKFKAGKVNKNGELVRPDTYTVVIKLNY